MPWPKPLRYRQPLSSPTTDYQRIVKRFLPQPPGASDRCIDGREVGLSAILYCLALLEATISADDDTDSALG